MKILLVDDHQLFMDGMGYILESLSDHVELTKVVDLSQVHNELSKNWDLILLDILMPGLNGMSLLAKIRKKNQLTKVVMISSSDDEEHLIKAQSLGANGFLAKSYSSERILECLKAILSGKSEFLSLETSLNTCKIIKEKRKAIGITKKQYEILVQLSKGYTNNQIAEHQNISLSTVKSHLAEVFRLLNVKTRIQCVNYARKINLI